MTRLGAFFHWLGHPFRAGARALMVLVNLSARQMQSLCTLAMIGGIIANSFWIDHYVGLVEHDAKAGMSAQSPFFGLALDVVRWLGYMSGGFALFMSLIAFGAEWLRLKYGDFEASTGHGDEPQGPA